MIKINRVWSEEGHFKELVFQSGINFIAGDSSKDESGNITNEQRNGSGKSLSIELINFALLKGSVNSRIVQEVPEDILPSDSFVNINLDINGTNVTLCRNKKNDIKMKIGNGDFADIKQETDAKKELEKLCEISDSNITFRGLMNFYIKESDYNYSTFLYFFTSNVIDRLKASLYFFDLPADIFEEVRVSQDTYEAYNNILVTVKKSIESTGYSVDKLRSLQMEYEDKIEAIKAGLTYDSISSDVQSASANLEGLEEELTRLLQAQGKIEHQLLEIKEYSSYVLDDNEVSEDELGKFFERYIKGLGDFVKKDLAQLKEFRIEVTKFEREMLSGQNDSLKEKQGENEKRINRIHEDIKKHQSLIKSGQNHLQRGLESSGQLMKEFYNNKKLIDDYDQYSQKKSDADTSFQNKYTELQASLLHMNEKEISFRKTFLNTHNEIYENKDGVFKFNLNVRRNVRIKEFFSIEALATRQGSEGVNRMRQMIYDLSLIKNEYTKKRSGSFMVHDRLLFGDIDHKVTINFLNHLYSLGEENFQYIGTYNTDVISEEASNNKLNFNVTDRFRVKLTIEEPIFKKDFKQSVLYDASK